jgi:hypothetical protein
MSLWPKDGIPGLLLTRQEYNEVVMLCENPVFLDDELQELIFSWTEGHVGAICEILKLIYTKVSYCTTLFTGFQTNITCFRVGRKCD